MAAIQRTRTSSFAAGAFVLAVSGALLAGATGGYLVRAVTSHVAAPSSTVANQSSADTHQGGPQSDLTRALPVASSISVDELPAWVQKYVESGKASPFKVDEMIESLSYGDVAAGGPLSDLTRVLPTETFQLPAWVQKYVDPARSRAFRVDELIDRLDYAQADGTAQVPAPALQFTP